MVFEWQEKSKWQAQERCNICNELRFIRNSVNGRLKPRKIFFYFGLENQVKDQLSGKDFKKMMVTYNR